MNSYKKWGIGAIVTALVFLTIAGGITVYIDPYFHFHKPISNLTYELKNQRYQNDGIAKNWEYETMIIGTSMTENFKTSECDELFQTTSIKVPYVGASFYEINQAVERALKYNSNLKMVIRALDFENLGQGEYTMTYGEYPDYLYDDVIWNDVKYIFNKEILFGDTWEVINYTQSGQETTSFDVYSSWDEGSVYGKEAIDELYLPVRQTEACTTITYDDFKKDIVRRNIEQNVIAVAKAHPDVQFYYFLTPYSIYYFDRLNQAGDLERSLQIERDVVEMIITCDNIHLYSFFDEFEMVTNLDNYKDTIHYSGAISSYILKCMAEGSHELTEDNYKDYLDSTYEFYINYDYNSLFEN